MVKRTVLLALVLVVGASASPPAQEAKTCPAHVLIIRHAEKPPAGDDSDDLSARGKGRAEALRQLFQKSDTRVRKLPRPDFIFATKDSRKSRRPTQTVAPLARKLGLKVNASHANDDFAKLAHELFHDPKYAGKTVLICWHHGKVPELAGELHAAGVPEGWKDGVFDRVWRIDYQEKGKARLRNLPQHLLAGDSEK